jgi:hypothetical protein
MKMKTNPTRALSFAALCLPCLNAVAQGTAPDAQRVAQAAPTSLEADYWRSTEKLGTPAAYQAYLAAFPNGFFARLAAAALAKADAAAPQRLPPPVSQPAPQPVWGAAPGTAPASVFPDAAALQKITGDADSSAVSFKIGDVFEGPGPLTVGRLGSHKQFVLPTGRWVALAAEDGYSAHRMPVQMTAMAFGLFDGQAVRSIVTAVFNQRAGRSGNSGWEDAQRCEGVVANAKFQWRGATGFVKQCVLVKGFSSLGPTGSWKGNIWEAVRDRLKGLGATADGAKGLVTEAYFTDNRTAYLRINRYDFGATETGLPTGALRKGPEDALDLRLEARIQWAQEYAGLAAVGFNGDIELDDLKPGGAAPNGPLRLVR